ncbi:MAG: hypothetical protein Q9201_003202 [Fulgogasparrea decipioides]
MFAFLPYIAVVLMVFTIVGSFRCTVDAEEWLLGDDADEKLRDFKPLLRNTVDHTSHMLIERTNKSLGNIVRHVDDVRLDKVPRDRRVEGMKRQLEAPHLYHPMVGRRVMAPNSGLDSQSDDFEEVGDVACGEYAGDDAGESLEGFGLELEAAQGHGNRC